MVKVTAVQERMEEKRHSKQQIPDDMESSHGGLLSMDQLMNEDADPEQRQAGHQTCGDLKQREGGCHQVDCGKPYPMDTVIRKSAQ